MREAKILTFGCVAACRRAVGDEGRDVVRSRSVLGENLEVWKRLRWKKKSLEKEGGGMNRVGRVGNLEVAPSKGLTGKKTRAGNQ